MTASANFDLESALIRAWPPPDWCDLNVVLAVSGGADSVAMLRAALAVKSEVGGRGALHVAHLNHGLRGVEAAADEAWLKSLCNRLEVPVELGHADVAAIASGDGDGWEAAARSARYDFLLHAAERIGARFVAVAHTADDQVETVVYRMIRGTGMAGLAGMPRVRPLSTAVSLVRPLLAVPRTDILQYLSALGQDFCIDATNADPRFTRNRIRRDLLPAIRSQFNAKFDEQILRIAQQAQESQAVLTELAAKLSIGSVEISPSTTATSAELVRIDCRALAGQPALLVREVCKTAWMKAGWPSQSMGFDQWQELASLVVEKTETQAAMFPGGVRAERKGQSLLLSRQP